MIIFGTRNKLKTVGTGQFYCPRCQAQRTYERKTAKRYFALYFVPLIPMGDLGEFVECTTCHMTYNVDVLKTKAPVQQVGAVELLNSVKSRLVGGDPVEYVVRDLTAAGIERDMALSLVQSTIGDKRKLCATCNLSYATDITRCQECQLPLPESA
ncbi:MAG: zinc ribbon domain-containing protein [Chloroflexi bacterium]|nr:zinc ribbon domain-containing protein [Chloroflexota bacterium]MCC6895539.1 zinc-ribbon domain-containing protein [Anaerolineae bacterium]